MENRFINRYNSFCRCESKLESSLNYDKSNPFFTEGVVQVFNLTFDLSWKVMKDILVKQMGIVGFASGSPSEVLSTAFTNGLIDSDVWKSMLKTRNQLSHDYNGDFAEESLLDIQMEYLPLFRSLRERCRRYYDEPARANFNS